MLLDKAFTTPTEPPRIAPQRRENVRVRLVCAHVWARRGEDRVGAQPRSRSVHQRHGARCRQHRVLSSALRVVAHDVLVGLIQDEILEQVHVRVSRDGRHVAAAKLVTNLRQSSWYGSSEGHVHKIVAPPGFASTCSTGSVDGMYNSLGAYFVPRELRRPPLRDCTPRGNHASSEKKPSRPMHAASKFCGAVVFEFGQRHGHITSLDPTTYDCHLALRETSPHTGTCELELVAGERIASVRALFDGVWVTSVQLVTTHRATEWFGPAPTEGATVVVRSIAELPTATHIGGFCGMLDGSGIKSLVAQYYKDAVGPSAPVT